MLKSRLLTITLLCSLFPLTAYGQHDIHRDAVRFIAAGEFEKVSRELSESEESDPETAFVRMLAALAQDDVPRGIRFAREALDDGLPIDRLRAGPRDALSKLYSTSEYERWHSQTPRSPLIHGPMLGAVTGDSARIWVRTAEESIVEVTAFDPSKPDTTLASAANTSRSSSDYACVVKLTGLKPNTRYTYSITVDDEELDIKGTSFQTSPTEGEPGEFKVGFGGGAGYIPEWESMWDTIREFQPNAFLMLGDNVYIDDPTHPLTQRYCYYRRQSRPEWRRLVRQTPMYAIYDDHDFGTNDCVPGPDIEKPAWKREVWNVFRENWANPAYGGGEEQPGCWYDFQIGDVHFIMLDGRYYRTRRPEPAMLGPIQKTWLLDTLQSSTGTFKILVSPVPWSQGVKPGSNDPWDGFAREREEIFSFIEENRIEGVFLVAADRHRTDLRVTPRTAGYDLYEFESSKLTNRHTHGVVKTEGMIWGYNKTCSFGLMEFDTTLADPSVTFSAISIDGETIHTHELKRSQLTFD